MHTKELGKSGEDATDMPGISCQHLQFYSPLRKVSRSGSRSHVDTLNLSPRPAHHCYRVSILVHSGSRKIGTLEWVPSLLELALYWIKPETQLVKEIAALELEVLHLERYLLSLYRAAFDQQLAASRVKGQACESPSTSQAQSPLQDSRVQEKCEPRLANSYQPSECTNSCNNRGVDNSCSQVDGKKKDEFKFQHFGEQSRNELADSEDGNAPPTGKQSATKLRPCDLLSSSSLSAEKNVKETDLCKGVLVRHMFLDSSGPTSRHRSLADHLCSSIIECVSNTPSKLSEEIIRCISSIYNKLSVQPVPQLDFSVSPISSISSSSTFSPQDTYDAWSPKYHYETIMSPYHSKVPKDKQGPYSRMPEVHKICIDGNRFDYAAKMLQNFRALICQLEAVDPIKMEHEEKLAFWINIHNALVMHAYLAYGLRQNQMKSTSSIMKAAYKVGVLSINAQEIQSSILGCQPHRPEMKLQKLFPQSQKLMKGRLKHPYAVNQIEPLVHFALCMGAYSDPAIRIYTAKNVLEELELARDEFVRSNVWIRKETKIILPKILQFYAREAAMDLRATLQMVHDCVHETQRKALRMCLKGKPERCVEWSSYRSDFRYIIHEDLLAKE